MADGSRSRAPTAKPHSPSCYPTQPSDIADVRLIAAGRPGGGLRRCFPTAGAPSVTIALRGMSTILIIDDNDTIRDGLAHTIKKLGHDAVTASGSAPGIEAFKLRRPDFVITDLKMEGPSGVDVLRVLSGLDPDVPIMIITGFGTVETAVEAMKLGAFDFITKPIQPE